MKKIQEKPISTQVPVWVSTVWKLFCCPRAPCLVNRDKWETPDMCHPGGLSLPRGVSPPLPPQCRRSRATQDAYSWLQKHRRWWRTKLRRELGLLTPPSAADQAVLLLREAGPCPVFSPASFPKSFSEAVTIAFPNQQRSGHTPGPAFRWGRHG